MSPRGRASKRKTKLPNRLKDTDYEGLKNSKSDTKSDDSKSDETMGKKVNHRADECNRSKEGTDSQKGDVECLESDVSGSVGDMGCVDAVEFPTLNESIRKKGVSVSNTASKHGNGSIVKVGVVNEVDFPPLKESCCLGKAIQSEEMDGNNAVKDTGKQSSSGNTTNKAPLSFASTVKIGNDEMNNKLELVPLAIRDGRELVVIEDDLVNEGCLKWKHTLCGHFVGYKMPYAKIQFKKNVE